MNTATRTLLIGTLCLSGFAGPAAADTLTNPSFEDDLTGWTQFGTNAYVEGDGPQDGVKAVKMFQAFWGTNNFTGVFQDVPVTPGTAYTVAGYLRNGNSTGGDALQTGNDAFLKIEWLDAGDAQIGQYEHSPANGGGVDPDSPVGEWMLNEFDVTAPPEAASGRVVAIHRYLGSAYEGGASWFDNVSITTVPEPSTLLLLAAAGIGLLGYVQRRR